MATRGERAWYAYHCLPRGKGGKPPTIKSLAAAHEVPASTFTRLFNDERTGLQGTTAMKVAAALNVSVEWLLEGVGSAPSSTGEIPPRPGAEDAPAWRPTTQFSGSAPDVLESPYASLRELYYLNAEDVHPNIWRALAQQRMGEDPGTGYWQSEIARLQAARNGIISIVRPVEDSSIDHVPGQKRKR